MVARLDGFLAETAAPDERQAVDDLQETEHLLRREESVGQRTDEEGGQDHADRIGVVDPAGSHVDSAEIDFGELTGEVSSQGDAPTSPNGKLEKIR